MQPLIDSARLFGQRPEELTRLAEGQSPDVPFVTCSGSRAVPALIIEQGVEAGRLQSPGRYYEVPTGNVRQHRMEPGTSETP